VRFGSRQAIPLATHAKSFFTQDYQQLLITLKQYAIGTLDKKWRAILAGAQRKEDYQRSRQFARSNFFPLLKYCLTISTGYGY
jgi:hypothetical protein